MKAIILTLSLICTLFAEQNKNFEIIQPKSKTVYKEAFSTIVIKLKKNSKIKKIQISSKDDTYLFTVEKKREIYCKILNLKPGNNKYKVTFYSKKSLLYKKDLDLFYNSEVLEEGVIIPDGYTKDFFHKNKNEKLCSKCHDMDNDNKKLAKLNKANFAKNQKSYDLVFDDVKKSNCFTCHKSVVSRKSTHAPSANFLCTKCHSGETSAFNKELKNKSQYMVPDPVDSVCFSCHETKENEKWYEKKYKHGPVMTGRCTKCHNPHSSDNLFFLKKPIWKLCTTCHDEKAKGKHVITSFVFAKNAGAHPTQGRPDPARPGRELVCSGCHNPHGSEGKYLLRMKSNYPFNVCSRCHQK